MKTLDQLWREAKAEHDRLALRYGPRSKRTEAARAKMVGLLVRILRRDNRRRAA